MRRASSRSGSTVTYTTWRSSPSAPSFLRAWARVASVTGQTLVLPSGVTRVNLPSMSGGGIQNGAPDGVLVIRTTDGALLDALSYEGTITSTTVGGRSYSLVEGTALDAMIADTGTGTASLARVPNGTDTNDSAADWEVVTRVTPGDSNDGM